MKKLKKLALLVGVAVFAISFMAANFAGIGFAAGPLVGDRIVTITNNLKTEYDLGEVETTPVVLPGGAGLSVIIRDPSGTEVKKAGGGDYAPGENFVPDYAGYYTVDLYKTVGTRKVYSRQFSFLVNAEEYKIELPYGGAEIPTLIRAGAKVENLPSNPVLIYTNNKGDVVEADKDIYTTGTKSDIKVTVMGNVKKDGKYVYEALEGFGNISATDLAGKSFTTDADLSTKYFVTYSFDQGGISIQNSYTISTEKDLNDTSAPEISVSVTGDAKLMTEFKLPTATATHAKDSNVKVEVKVTDPDGIDKVYTVTDDMLDEKSGELGRNSTKYIKDQYKDKAGAEYYAKDADTNANLVKFDNNRNMTFYPHKTGKYLVTYTATVDAGMTREDGAPKTASKVFTVTVEDTLAPKLKITSSDIVSEWSDTITSKDKTPDTFVYDYKLPRLAAAGEGEEKNFSVIDNAILESGLKFTVTITTPNKDTLSVTDTDYNKTADGKYWLVPISKLTEKGSYEVRYHAAPSAADDHSTTVSETFNFTMVDSIVDTTAPVIEVSNLQKTIIPGQSFTKPKITVTDTKDESTSTNTYVKSEIVYTLKGSTDKVLEDEVFYNNAIDKFDAAALGVADADRIEISVTGTDSVGNVTTETKTVKIVDTGKTSTTTIEISDVFGAAGAIDVDPAGVITAAPGMNAGKHSANTKFTLPNVTATMKDSTGTADDYMGYQVTVREPITGASGYSSVYGDILDGDITVTSWVDPYAAADTRVMHLEDISFTPKKAGTYTITVSFFDVTGMTVSTTLYLEVETVSGGTEVQAAAASIPAQAEFGTTVSLPSYKLKVGDNYPEETQTDYIFRTTVTGRHFSLWNREFSPLAKGDYTVTQDIPITANANIADSHKPLIRSTSSSIAIEDTTGPSIRLKTLVPLAHTDVTKDLEVPGVVTSDLSGVSSSEVEIINNTVSGSSAIKLKLDEATGKYVHKVTSENPLKDGKYTLTYTVKDNNGTASTQTYSIDVGDVFIPVITMKDNATYVTTSKVGKEFKFKAATAKDSYYTKETIEGGGYQMVLTEKTVTSDVRIDLKLNGTSTGYTNSGTTVRDDAFTFEEAGTYTVEYTVTDTAGNTATKTFTIQVSEKTKGGTLSDKALAVILVVVGVVVIAGVVLFVFRYRKKV